MPRGGTFFEPTVLTDVTTDMVVSKKKTFGPVAPLHRFKTDAEAIEMANEAPTLTLPRPRGRKQGAAPICRSATSAASGASPRRRNTASLASTRASSRTRRRDPIRNSASSAHPKPAVACIRLRLPSGGAPELTLDQNLS